MNKGARTYPARELQVILDNSSSHRTAGVQAWLARHLHIHFHDTPTSASWLNQVEGFVGIFSKQSLSLTDRPSKSALRGTTIIVVAISSTHFASAPVCLS